MLRTLKKINNVLRVLFIGFIALYTIAKVFRIVPKDDTGISTENAEHATSEFDEIW